MIKTQSIVTADIPAIDKEKVRDRISTQVYNRCPYLARHSKPAANHAVPAPQTSGF